VLDLLRMLVLRVVPVVDDVMAEVEVLVVMCTL
jgi:hypothetical protein